MRHLKKFFELFDTEDLKAEHEIDYLSGNFKKMPIVNNFKDESIVRFVSKLSLIKYKFFDVFHEAGDSDSVIKFNNFEAYITPGDDGYWIMVTTSKDFTIGFGVRIDKVNQYDIFINFDDENNLDNEDKNYSIEKENITFDEVKKLIEDVYIPFLKEAGHDELLSYDSGEYSDISN